MKNFQSFIHSSAIVESSCIGEGTRIWPWTHIMSSAQIGKGCNIGEHCYIENDVIVGDFCTIKNQVAIWNGVILEDYVFIGPSVVFTNDKYPRSREKNWELKKTIIRRYATLGAGAIILCGIEIGPFAMIGAGALVSKSIPGFSLVVGNPGKVTGYVCACGKPLKEKSNKKIECLNCGRMFKIEKTLILIGGPELP